jgi:hypothetical protein
VLTYVASDTDIAALDAVQYVDALSQTLIQYTPGPASREFSTSTTARAWRPFGPQASKDIPKE